MQARYEGCAAGLPEMFLFVRSMSMRGLSVPPVVTEKA